MRRVTEKGADLVDRTVARFVTVVFIYVVR